MVSFDYFLIKLGIFLDILFLLIFLKVVYILGDRKNDLLKFLNKYGE